MRPCCAWQAMLDPGMFRPVLVPNINAKSSVVYLCPALITEGAGVEYEVGCFVVGGHVLLLPVPI